MTPIERARQAKATHKAAARLHRCPSCGAEVTTYVRADVFHRCKQRPPRGGLALFEEVSP